MQRQVAKPQHIPVRHLAVRPARRAAALAARIEVLCHHIAAGRQFRRIARTDDHFGPARLPLAAGLGVVDMTMGQHDPADLLGPKAQPGQLGQHFALKYIERGIDQRQPRPGIDQVDLLIGVVRSDGPDPIGQHKRRAAELQVPRAVIAPHLFLRRLPLRPVLPRPQRPPCCQFRRRIHRRHDLLPPRRGHHHRLVRPGSLDRAALPRAPAQHEHKRRSCDQDKSADQTLASRPGSGHNPTPAARPEAALRCGWSAKS